MQTSIRQKLHQLIDTIKDNKAAAIDILFENEIGPHAQRRKLILSERQEYHNGKGKSFSWDEAKGMAEDKAKRSAL